MRKRMDTCRWTQNQDGVWETDCKQAFVLNEGTPRDNHMRFCHNCGKALRFTSHPGNRDYVKAFKESFGIWKREAGDAK